MPDLALSTGALSFAGDVRAGLSAPRKYLQPWWFYDALGSALFSAICELPEYYVTRAESEILTRHGAEIARAFGDADRLVELGSGDCRKTSLLLRPLLERLPHLTYVPIDIDPTVLEKSSRDLLLDFSSLRIEPICGDYRNGSELIVPGGHTAVMFLGSSIGNLDLQSATAMLREVRLTLAPGDPLLLGVDLQKAREIVEPAYDDPLGVTAAFNLNVLARINRELGGAFDLAKFRHRAFLNQKESRIEMHLVSSERQSVRIEALGMSVHFEAGEAIHTENSYKYTESQVATMAADSGFDVSQTWTDARRWFADVLLVAR